MFSWLFWWTFSRKYQFGSLTVQMLGSCRLEFERSLFEFFWSRFSYLLELKSCPKLQTRLTFGIYWTKVVIILLRSQIHILWNTKMASYMIGFYSDQKTRSKDPIFERSWKWGFSKINLHGPSINLTQDTCKKDEKHAICKNCAIIVRIWGCRFFLISSFF